MADVRLMFDDPYLYAFHLNGKTHTLVIDRVAPGELVGEGGRKTRKPIVYFKGKKLGLALNKTNARTIIGIYGAEVNAWLGKPIAIYPTTTKFGRDVVDCIRVRPSAPRGQADTSEEPTEQQRQPSDEQPEPGSDG